MKKILKGIRAGAVAAFGVVLAAAFFCTAPLSTARAAAVSAQEAEERVTSLLGRNANLVVKYGLDEVKDGKLSAYTWDSESQSYLPATEMDATVVNDGGSVSQASESVEGTAAMGFTGLSRAEASFHLPAEATGMTISIWVKDIIAFWGDTVEFWNGSSGARFGKGSMQANNGNRGVWASNCPSYDYGTYSNGGTRCSFVTEMILNDDEASHSDIMQKGVWYQVTYTIDHDAVKMYRDGALKITFARQKDGEDQNEVPRIIDGILDAARDQTNGKLGIRSAGTDSTVTPDILDDFRIYNGAMEEAQVQALYEEYKGIKAIHGKEITIDGFDGTHRVDDGSNIYISGATDEFPKIHIGGVQDVTEREGTFSGEGNGFSYTYTVKDETETRVATVIYTDTASGDAHVFTVTQNNRKMVRLTSLKVVIDGKEQDVEGFNPDTTKYTVVIPADAASVSLKAEAEYGGTTNADTLNADLKYNDQANELVTAGSDESEVPVTYQITLKRDRADEALPVVNEIQLDYAKQAIYTDDAPAGLTDSCVVRAYPNGSEMKSFRYEKNVVSFTLEDKLLKTTTEYRLAYKAKEEGQIAYWSFDESKSGDNKVYEGQSWQGGSMQTNSALDMTVRGGAYNESVSETRSATAATPIEGVKGKAIEIGGWDYTTAAIPKLEDATTGFTFSAWIKEENHEKPWEAVFAVLGKTHGTIFEKGTMQWHVLDGNGNPNNGWDNLANSTGEWADSSLNDDLAKGTFFDTPSDGAPFVFYTVTVSYVNGTGRIYMYKDGELAVTFVNDDGVTEKAKITIEAINEGAKVGLRRHHLDSDHKARFDEARVYAYAMTAEEIAAQYNEFAQLLSVVPATYKATGLSYPDLLLGGAQSVSDEGGVKKGTTASGLTYSYTPIQAPATPDKDSMGVEVTVSTEGGLSRKSTVTFTRELGIKAEKLGYKIGTEGANQNIAVPASNAEDIQVKVPANTDFSQIQAGENAVQKFTEDNTDNNYTAEWTYDSGTHTATVRCSYTPYPGQDTVYRIVFSHKSEETFTSMQVTGGKENRTFTPSDFDEGNTPEVPVDSLAEFSLTVHVSLAAGASLTGGEEGTVTLTQADIKDTQFLEIKITNENEEEKTYRLKLVALSSDATLTALSVDGYELSPAFAAGTSEYTVTVPVGEAANVLGAVEFTAAAGATAQKTYDATEKKITITVTAADGRTTGTYVITIRERSAASDDATLSSIEVNGTAVEGFSPEKTEYTVKYKGTATVTATAASSEAEVEVGQPDADGKVKITVTAENGTTKKEYTVTLVKMSAEAELLKLTLNGTEITLTSGEGSYTAPAGVRLEAITAVAEVSEGATYSVTKANGKITVTVTSEDGEHTSAYTVTVTLSSPSFEEGENEDNSPDLKGCGSTVLGAGAAFAALLGAAFCCKRRKNR